MKLGKENNIKCTNLDHEVLIYFPTTGFISQPQHYRYLETDNSVRRAVLCGVEF